MTDFVPLSLDVKICRLRTADSDVYKKKLVTIVYSTSIFQCGKSQGPSFTALAQHQTNTGWTVTYLLLHMTLYKSAIIKQQVEDLALHADPLTPGPDYNIGLYGFLLAH